MRSLLSGGGKEERADLMGVLVPDFWRARLPFSALAVFPDSLRRYGIVIGIGIGDGNLEMEQLGYTMRREAWSNEVG